MPGIDGQAAEALHRDILSGHVDDTSLRNRAFDPVPDSPHNLYHSDEVVRDAWARASFRGLNRGRDIERRPAHADEKGESYDLHPERNPTFAGFVGSASGRTPADVKERRLFEGPHGRKVAPSLGRTMRHVGVAAAIAGFALAVGTALGTISYYLSGKKKKFFELTTAIVSAFVAIPHLATVFNARYHIEKLYPSSGEFHKDLQTTNLRTALRQFKQRYPDLAQYLRTQVKYGNNDLINAKQAEGSKHLRDALFQEPRLVCVDERHPDSDAKVLSTLVNIYRSYDEPSLKRFSQSLRLGWSSWARGSLLPGQQAEGAGRLVPYALALPLVGATGSCVGAMLTPKTATPANAAAAQAAVGKGSAAPTAAPSGSGAGPTKNPSGQSISAQQLSASLNKIMPTTVAAPMAGQNGSAIAGY